MQTKIGLFVILFIFSIKILSVDVYGEIKTNYTIQVGAYEGAENAEIMYQKLKKAGFSVNKKVKGQRIVISVGNFESMRTAQSTQSDLKSINVNGYIITKKEDIRSENSRDENNDNMIDDSSNVDDTNSNDADTAYNVYSEKFVKNYKFVNDIKVEGVFQSYNFYFNTSSYWEIDEESYVEIVFSRTDIGNYKNSNLSVLINDYPVYSDFIYDKEKMKAKIKIKLPKDKIVKGFNNITFKTYNRISEDACEDIINPGNWLVFNKESYVHIEYTKVNDTTNISDFPYPYIQNEESIPMDVTIFTADDIKSEAFRPVVLMSALLSKKASLNQLGMDIEKIKDISKNKDKSAIFIGKINDLPDELIKYFSDDEKNIAQKEAVIKEVVAPYNDSKKLLFIVSNDNESLSKAIQVLEHPDLVGQMGESTYIIKKDVVISNEKSEDDDYFTFKELGYGSLFFEGALYQAGTVDVELEKGWSIEEGAKLHLNMRYSEVINYERSALTLYLNNVPIASKSLSKELANKDEIDIEIPKDLLDNDYYQLEIVFYFKMYDEGCEYVGEKNSWAYILNDSYFYLPHKYEIDKSLDYYGNPFVTQKASNDLLFIIPDDDDFDDLKAIGNIVTYMVKKVEDIDSFDVIKASELSEKYNDYNMVVVGTPKDNKVIQDWNEYLHIQFNDAKNKFQSNEKITLLEDYNKELSSIQLITSPYNSYKRVMIITSTVDKGVRRAIKYLVDPELSVKLAGNAVIIDERGEVQYKNFEVDIEDDETKIKEESNSKLENGNDKKNFNNMKIFLIWVVGIFIIIVVFLVVLIRKK